MLLAKMLVIINSSGTFDIAGGSDPATHGFEFTSLPDICTGKTDLWDFIVFDD